jgi:WD40 repeat protein
VAALTPLAAGGGVMRLLPRSARGTWLLAAAAWIGLCVAALAVLPERLERRGTIVSDGPFSPIVFGPDGRWLATRGDAVANGPHTLRFWDTATGRPVAILAGNPQPVHELFVSPDGRWLLTVEYHAGAPTVRLWDAKTGATLGRLAGDWAGIDGSRFGPSGAAGSVLACTELFHVRLLEMPTLRPLVTLVDASRPIAFSGDGRYVATGWGPPHAIAVWEVATGRRVANFEYPEDVYCDPEALTLSPTGDRLVAAFSKGYAVGLIQPDCVRVVDVASSATVVDRPSAIAAGVTSEPGAAAVWEYDPTSPNYSPLRLRAFDTQSGIERYTVVTGAHSIAGSFVRASVGGRWLAVEEDIETSWDRAVQWVRSRLPVAPSTGAGHQGVGIYDLTTGRRHVEVAVSTEESNPLLVSPDGRMLAIREGLTVIGVWELPPRKPLTWFALGAAMLALPLAGLALEQARVARQLALAG